MPNALEARLRNSSVTEFFTSVFCSREANYTDKNGKVFERNLQATELCDGQDLEKQAALIKDNDARLTSALSVFSDMADFLEKLQTEHAAFPDMKLANWLMDEKGRVRISDTKSFLETSARGRIWFRHGLNEEAPLLVTPCMNPPELKASKTKAFSADKMHAYMLGKCLYQYVTAVSPHVFYKKDARGRNQVITDARELSFTHPVFDGETGAALRALIEASVKNNPDERPSLSEMHAQIKALGVQHAAVQTTQAFREAVSAARSDSDTPEVKSDTSFKPT